MNRVVIIGSGQAGVDCAFGLRQQGHAGQITLVGDDPELPYQRPPLSKDVLKSRGQAGWLPLRGEALYTKQDISLQLGQRVREIRRADRQVILEGGSTLPYDQLILATGARNRLPPLPGLAEATPMALRNAADTRRLIAALPDMGRLAIIGGGFIGLETAAALHGSSTEVTLYEAAPRLMSRSVSPELSDWFRRFHEARGTIIRTEARIEEVLPGQLRLSDGEIQAHDALLLAAGVMPNVELAADAGLEIGNGICTDATHATSDPAIFAIGDCAEAPNPFSPSRSGWNRWPALLNRHAGLSQSSPERPHRRRARPGSGPTRGTRDCRSRDWPGRTTPRRSRVICRTSPTPPLSPFAATVMDASPRLKPSIRRACTCRLARRSAKRWKPAVQVNSALTGLAGSWAFSTISRARTRRSSHRADCS